jgi:O-methyltransferase/aklanonic acid methyltransferase
MTRTWSRPIGVPDPSITDYWEFFGTRLVQHARISPGAKILDVGCGGGSSLFPAARQVSPNGYSIGIDICPH